MSRPRHRRLRLVVGGPGEGPSGIREALVEEIRRLKSGDPLRPVTILVGSNYQRLHLQRHLAIRLGGHANISFLLLKDLARTAGAPPLIGRGRRRLPDLGREILVQEAVSALSHGTYFDRIAGKEGFLEALSATIRDLKEAMIDPAALRATAGALRTSAPERLSAGKLDDLADLFEAYDDLLRDRRFYDDEDLMRSALSRAADPDGPPVLLYGFYDATWLQRLFIQEAMAFREGVVFFPFVEGPEFDYALPTLRWFESWIQDREDRKGRGSEPPAIEILSAPGESREVLEVTRWLIQQCREHSFPMGQLGLIYRTPEPYLDLVPEVMSQAGRVPRFLAGGSPMASEPSARALLTLLKVRDESFSRRSVIDFLTVTTRGSRAALWDRVSRRAGITKGVREWRDKLDRLSARGGPEGSAAARDAEAAHGLSERLADLAVAIESIPREGSWSGMTGIAIDLMRRFAPDEDSSDRVAEELSRLGALDEVSTPVGIEPFVRLVRRLLERDGSVRGEGEFQKSGIFVGSVIDARLLSFSAVAVVGLVERSFPMPPRQDPILLDEERRHVNDLVGGDRLPIKARRLEEERLLFRLACSSASDKLLLSYPRLDPATARPRSPSPFLLAAASERPGVHLTIEALEGLPGCRRVSLSAPAPSDPAEAILKREYDLSVIRQAPSDPAGRGQVASFLHSRPILHRALEAEEARWGARRFTSFDGVILRPSLLEALRKWHPTREVAISASRIEEYASCPLAYFMKKVLRLEAMEDPETTRVIDPLVRGGLIHEILAEVFTRLRDGGALPLRAERMEETEAILEEVAERLLEKVAEENVTGTALQWQVEKETILMDLATFLWKEAMADAKRVPAYFELGYGMEGEGAVGADRASIPDPVPFEIGGRVVRLKGKVDRVEIDPAGMTAGVTDYKTGKMDRYRADTLQAGRSVQLPLYMIAVERVLQSKHPGIRVEEASYRSVTGRGSFKQVPFGAGTLVARREELARILGTVLDGIDRGVFFARPVPETCRYCDYKLACGEGREARFERKKGDPAAGGFIAMEEADR